MLIKILNSNWIAYPIVIVSAILVALLYFKGKTLAALVCAVFLIISIALIFLGQKSMKDSGQSRK